MILGMTSGLAAIKTEIEQCTKCKLHQTRTNTVPGEGADDAKWLFVGEGPGQQEDLQGRPFVGKSGELLNKLIEEAGWSRTTVHILNVLRCRPPGNRDPEADEVTACTPFLNRQIKAINPLVITTLGKPAAHLLLNSKEPLYKLRGGSYYWEGIPVVPTYHPSYIQRGNWNQLPKMHVDLLRAQKVLLDAGEFLPANPKAWALEGLIDWLSQEGN